MENEQEQHTKQRPLKRNMSVYEPFIGNSELIKIQSREGKMRSLSKELVQKVPAWRKIETFPIETDIPTNMLTELLRLIKTMEKHPKQKIQKYWVSKFGDPIIECAQQLELAGAVISDEACISVASLMGINQKALNFSSKKIDNLQGLERITDIENTEELYLCDNFIWDIPSNTFSLFTALIALDLSNNCLERLPDLSGLLSLELLDCSDNGIESLVGSNLHKCERLGWLELKQNRLTRVRPTELPATLSFLFLEGNELDDESKEDLKGLNIFYSSGLD